MDAFDEKIRRSQALLRQAELANDHRERRELVEAARAEFEAAELLLAQLKLDMAAAEAAAAAWASRTKSKDPVN